MTNLKDSILRLTILMAALLVMPRPGAAQEDGYPALDLMVEAGQTYRDGLAECDASTIGRAGDAYLTVRQTLLADPAGLARQYQKLIPKSAYMIGWCRLRQAEILGDSDLRETALSYFDSVSSDAPGFLGGYARVMTGEIRLLQAVEQKYRLLCQGNLDSAHVEQLTRAINAARSDFAEADGLLEDGADQQALVHIKTEDVFYELARLHSSVGDSAKALAYLDSINYSPQSQSAGPSLAAYSRYCDAVTVLDRYLLALDDPSAKQTVSAQINRFGQVDRPFRLATIARLNGDYNAPIEDYETAAGLTYQRSNLSIPEAHYFRGFAHLGLATNEDSLRGINSAPAQVLGLAKEDFDNYVESVGNLRLDNDERLRYLVARAGHKSLVLGSALGETLSDEELVSLSVDDVKFLIRIAASTHTLARRRCIDALHRFFDAYLPRLQSGTLDDTRTADFEECSTALATRFTRDQALFYKGILQSLEAEGQIGPQAARTFEMAAATMAQVTGDFEAEAEYVRARCLCKARKYDEAEPLLRQLVQDYGSVRALYFYAMAFRGLNPLREAADTTAIKDELHGLMLAVREAIRIAGDRPEYDNFRINAHNMLTESLSGHFRHPDSLLIGGLDQLNCPETLSVDISGWTPELVMYETLSEKAAIGEQFEQESRKDLIGYGLPKLWLAPGQVYCGRSAIPIIANSFAAIPDSVHVDYIWRGRIQFADNDDNTLSLDQCHSELVKDGSLIDCVDSTSSHGAYFFDADIDMHDSVLVRATKEGFYLTTLKRTSSQPGDAFFKETLARKVRYGASDRTGSGPFEVTENNQDAYSFNLAAHRNSHQPPAELVERFAADRYLRDYAYDQSHNRYLAVSSQLNHGLIVYSAEGTADTLRLKASTNLDNAEGITVDSDGNIYIADWGNHRVLVLDSFGHERFSFSALGQNQTANSNQAARLVFPNRIVAEEDLARLDHRRQRHLLVSDWFGVHKFDAQGRYLDSPVRADQTDLEEGSIYEITLDGYGPGSTLRLHNLVTDQPSPFTAEE